MIRLCLRLTLLWAVGEAIFHLRLGEDTFLFWDVDYTTDEFVAEVHSRNFNPSGWTGIGFSNNGNLSDGSGDLCIVWRNHLSQSDDIQLTDVHVENSTGIILPDEQQDCQNFQYIIENGTVLKWTFSRKIITCDFNDYALEEGTTHLHWIKGDGPLYDIKGVSISQASQVGFKRVRFLKNIHEPPPIDKKTSWSFDVLNENVKVPGDETTYWCRIVKIPDKLVKPHQIIQFGVKVQPGNEELVHHMEVFHCVADVSVQFPSYSGPCDKSPKEISVCSRVIGAWTMGAEPLRYPPEAGFPIGGTEFNLYVRLEVHYNNPMLKSDWVDSSGLTFWVTDKLRKYEAGVIELGLEYIDKMAIPPRHDGFALTGICNRECTSVAFPPEGITVFASQLHTHLTGIRVLTRHFRPLANYESKSSLRRDQSSPDAYVELPFMNWDNHYSTHYQEIRPLKIPTKILPGDILLTSCTYKTTDRSKATLGGFSISDEMCVNYIHYYPRSPLEVCKSSVSWTALREYFQFMHDMEGQKIEPLGPVSSNYHGIEWTPFRSELLADFYSRAPIDMQCNKSDGTRFPGTWHDMPIIKFPDVPKPINPNEECYIGHNQDLRNLHLEA